jgi:hypothetical protein
MFKSEFPSVFVSIASLAPRCAREIRAVPAPLILLSSSHKIA